MRIILVLLVAAVTANKPGFGVYPGGKAPKKPLSVTPDLYCLACKAIVKESVKMLHGKTLQSDVIVVLDDMCDMWRYDTYDFHPPMMKKGCSAIQNYYEEELEWALVHRNELEQDVETYFCQHMIEACALPGSTGEGESDAPADSPDAGSPPSSDPSPDSTSESTPPPTNPDL